LGRNIAIGAAAAAVLGGAVLTLWPKTAGSQPQLEPFDPREVAHKLDVEMSTIRSDVASLHGDFTTARTIASDLVARARASESDHMVVDALGMQAATLLMAQEYSHSEAAAFEAMTLGEKIHYESGKQFALATYVKVLDSTWRSDEAKRWRS